MLKRFSNLATSETDWDWLYPPICYITNSKTAVFVFPALVKHFCMLFGSMAGANEFSILQPTIIPFNVLDCRQGTAQGQHFVRPVQQPLYPIPRFSQGSSWTSTVWQIRQATALNETCIQYINVGWCINEGNLPKKNVFASWSPSLYRFFFPAIWLHACWSMTTSVAIGHVSLSGRLSFCVERDLDSTIWICLDLFGPFHPKCQSALRLMCQPCFFQSYWYFKTS